MNFLKIFMIFFFVSFFLTQCVKKEKTSLITEEDAELQMIRAFREGYEEFEAGDALFAAKKFNEAELLFPQSIWASKAALMAAYVYYAQDYYFDAEKKQLTINDHWNNWVKQKIKLICIVWKYQLINGHIVIDFCTSLIGPNE